jgi:hypothetical protein
MAVFDRQDGRTRRGYEMRKRSEFDSRLLSAGNAPRLSNRLGIGISTAGRFRL